MGTKVGLRRSITFSRRFHQAITRSRLSKEGSRTRLWQNWLRDYDSATRNRHDFTCCTLSVWMYLIGGISEKFYIIFYFIWQ